MSTFDSHSDFPDQIRIEGENIHISFERTNDSTGVITWTIPPPAAGCTVENQAYNGIVIVGNTVANSVSNRPVDGTVYTGDPTLDGDLHAGSELVTGLVVGAFYNDKTTTSLTVSGLEANAAYFFTGHAVDNVNRYHQQGVSTYALPFLYNQATPDETAFQEVEFDASVSATDATGLAVGETYTINLNIDGTNNTIRVRGTEARTFGDLVDEINYQILFIENPFQGDEGPNSGAYWYTNDQLFQWDGETHNQLPVINEEEDPSDIEAGEYWVDTDDDNTLYVRSGGVWVETTPVESGYDPADPTTGAVWSEVISSPAVPTQAWKWDGVTWCERALFVREKDPSCAPELGGSTYWFDESTSILFVWNTTLSRWDQTEGIAWDVDPRSPAIGTLWFDDEENALFKRTNASTWTEISVIIQATTPSSATIDGTHWWNTVEQQLYVKQSGSPLWLAVDSIVWGRDPTAPESCDLWLDLSSSPQQLNVWDEANAEWDLVNSFTISTTDPSLPITLAVGTVWAQTGGTNFVYWEWDGSQFVQIASTNIIEAETDPTAVTIGDVWLDTVNSVYNERTSNTEWTEQEVVESPNDPTLLPVGTFWYDQTNNTLNMWNGATWVNIMFSVTPLYPTSGTLWFNTTTETLLEWNSLTLAWEESTPLATATLNSSRGVCRPNGNIVFATNTPGSSGAILVGEVETGSNLTTFVSTVFTLSGTLWTALDPRVATARPNVTGIDGLTGQQSYDRLGVGTDGSADERRELSDTIRRQLGHPTVTVELSKEDINTAIDKALEALRQRSASAYRRVYFMMDAKVGEQNYLLTNERVGFHKIVNVMGVWRITSAFLSTVHAAGVYGQTILQHLYHMGTYDLVSYHLISDYIEQLEQLFATRVTYTFDEGSREFFIFQRITRDERILLDCTIERTEQELITSRYTKPWIERWALGEAKLILSQIRGKYASLPGAGGGVALNAADLSASAEQDFMRCDQEVDDFVVNDIENLGIGSELIIG
jgi:hypothetical protein